MWNLVYKIFNTRYFTIIVTLIFEEKNEYLSKFLFLYMHSIVCDMFVLSLYPSVSYSLQFTILPKESTAKLTNTVVNKNLDKMINKCYSVSWMTFKLSFPKAILFNCLHDQGNFINGGGFLIYALTKQTLTILITETLESVCFVISFLLYISSNFYC